MLPDTPFSPRHDPRGLPADDALRRQTQLVVSFIVLVAALAVGVYLYGFTAHPSDALAPAVIGMAAALAHGLVRTGRDRYAPHLLIVAVLIAACLAAANYGSVRWAGSMLFLAAVTGAGIFTGRVMAAMSAVSSLVMIGVLTLAERLGWMAPRSETAGLAALVTYMVCILVVALMIQYSQQRHAQAVQRLKTELEARQRTEEERDRLMRRFSRMFHASPSPMVAQSAISGVILDVNHAFERTYGYTRDQMLGRTDHFFWVNRQRRNELAGRLLSERRLQEQEIEVLHASGYTCRAALSSELSEDEGERLVISTVADVTDKRRREHQLLEMARGMTATSAQDFFVLLTDHMAKALEADATCVSELLTDGRLGSLAVWRDGKLMENYVYPVQGTPCGDAFSQTGLCVVTDGLDRLYAHRELLVREGFKAYVGQPLLDENGRPVGMIYAMWRQPLNLRPDARAMMAIFASRATSELLRLQREREIRALNASLEQRVQERTADLIQLNAELDSFAYSVSHDLKSPLRSIDGFTRLLSEQLQDRLQPDEAAMITRVQAATSRMSNLIADLLALARVSQGPLEREQVDLSEMVNGILDAEMQRQPGRRLERHVASGQVVSCDPRLTRIALENLLGNALKYSRGRELTVIEFGPCGPDELCLKDNGVGFDMAYAEKLFKPFQRLHMPSQFEGTGIGLATVRRIVERHGGGISGRGQPGEGSEFRFGFGPATLNGPQDPLPRATPKSTARAP